MVTINAAQIKGQEKSTQGIKSQRVGDQEAVIKGNRREKKIASQRPTPKS
jgi:hypothetical protein